VVIRGRDLDGVAAAWLPAPPLDGLSGLPGALPLLQLTLAEQQERALIQSGVRFKDAPPTRGFVALREDAYVTEKTIGALLADAGNEDLVARIGGRSGGLAANIALSTPDEPLLAWLAGGGPITPERLAAARIVELDPEERLIELPVPRAQFGADMIELPLTERLLLPCGHWMQLLWANLLGMAPFLWRSLAGRNAAEVVWTLGLAAARTGSVRPERIAARLGRRGRGCRVHPSAVVEGCWLGDDVQIGAGAVVRGCVMGDGAAVEDLALVEFSVLGAGARVQRQGMLKFSVAHTDSSIGGVMQLGVLDRGAAVKRGALMMDMAFGQQVRVRHRGVLTAAPLGLAGVCVGKDTLVGAGVQIAGGRAVPAGVQITADANVLVRIPDPLPGEKLVVRGGTLEGA
jgi:hypothetical protein